MKQPSVIDLGSPVVDLGFTMPPRRPIPTWLKLLGGLGLLIAFGAGARKVVLKMGLTEKARLDQLQPHVRAKVVELLRRMAAKGIPIYVGSTRRTKAQQAEIVARGSSAAPVSWHLLGRAVDLYPLDGSGKPDLKGSNVQAFLVMAREAEKLGFRQIAFKPDGSKNYITTSAGKVWDAGHIEYRDGMTIAEAAKKESHLIA